jgi:monothiol glutaredoxin
MKEQIEKIVKDNDVVLFMKGEKQRPLCRFSAQAVAILNMYDVDFHGVNILEDDQLRQAVKEYSQWPTYPQLYIKGELIGGGDVMVEIHENGEFEQLLA